MGEAICYLREHLEEYTKEELLDQARRFELKKCSGLRKTALIDRILEAFLGIELVGDGLAGFGGKFLEPKVFEELSVEENEKLTKGFSVSVKQKFPGQWMDED